MSELLDKSLSGLAAELSMLMPLDWQNAVVDVRIVQGANMERIDYQVVNGRGGSNVPGNSTVGRVVVEVVEAFRCIKPNATDFSIVFECANDDVTARIVS